MEEPNSIFNVAFWITAGTIMCLLVLSSFFSGSETALTAASRGKLRSQADKGSRGAQRALEITDDSERLIGSVSFGKQPGKYLSNVFSHDPVFQSLWRRQCSDGNLCNDFFSSNLCRSATKNLRYHKCRNSGQL